MSLYKVQCEVLITAEDEYKATSEVHDVLNHAVKNYDGWVGGSVEMAVVLDEEA